MDSWSGRLTGFDYAGARAAVAGEGLRWRDVFARLRVMESAILGCLAAKRDKCDKCA